MRSRGSELKQDEEGVYLGKLSKYQSPSEERLAPQHGHEEGEGPGWC